MVFNKIKTAAKRVAKFVTDVAVAVKDKVVGFVKGVYHHAEATTVLVLSSVGLSALIGELPFWLTLPMWVEAPMVIPVVSVLTIATLMWNAERRANKRLA